MTNNTIPNVPRELLERASNLAFQTQHYPLHEELRTILSAPSPAGVDGLAVSSSGWFSLVMNAAAELETASYSITDPDAKRVAQSGADYYRSKAKSAQVVFLSDAQAIIDGLRGENERIRLNIAEYNEAISCYQSERDQQAQRIGELEGLLRESGKTIHKLQAEQPNPLRIARYLDAMRAKIDTALSAGKDGE